jgi:hypothetical protein
MPTDPCPQTLASSLVVVDERGPEKQTWEFVVLQVRLGWPCACTTIFDAVVGTCSLLQPTEPRPLMFLTLTA